MKQARNDFFFSSASLLQSLDVGNLKGAKEKRLFLPFIITVGAPARTTFLCWKVLAIFELIKKMMH